VSIRVEFWQDEHGDFWKVTADGFIKGREVLASYELPCHVTLGQSIPELVQGLIKNVVLQVLGASDE
jgi:hypothetical protein